MKPRTKLQREVADLATLLRPISKNQEQWAYKECLDHMGYANKTSAFCLDCGETFPLELVKRKRATCPHCNTKLKIEQSRKTTREQTNYFAITSVCWGYQIVQNFELKAYYKKGSPVKHFLHEIIQYWFKEDLKVTMFGLNHHNQGCCDSWGGSMEIRTENNRSWSGAKYDVYPRMYHPDSVFKPEYQKIGIDHDLKGLTLLEAIKLIKNNPKVETLVKAKQYWALSVSDSWRISNYWETIRICLRNKYKPNEGSIYFDYLELLRYFKKDLRNPFYVCPKNLKKEHDKFVKKKRHIQRLEEQERARKAVIERQKRLEEAAEQYGMRNAKFFHLEFKKGNISIHLLRTVNEFKEEGDELKHCVFANEYYLKENSLIFSARVNGKRTETIEVKLDSLKIEQSRGISNNPSQHNKEIVALMKRNLPKIRKALKQENQQQYLQQSA